jgi:hypothetical protein
LHNRDHAWMIEYILYSLPLLDKKGRPLLDHPEGYSRF